MLGVLATGMVPVLAQAENCDGAVFQVLLNARPKQEGPLPFSQGAYSQTRNGSLLRYTGRLLSEPPPSAKTRRKRKT
jgi:hypothetical protein